LSQIVIDDIFSFNPHVFVLCRSKWPIHPGIELKGGLGKEDLAKYILATALRLTEPAQLR
jgi:hypothetical protein